MAYNAKARETNLKKYGHPCSLHGPNGVLKQNKDYFLKSQKANIDRVKAAKKRLLDGLKIMNIELLSDISNLNKLYGKNLEYKCNNCNTVFWHIQRYKIPECPGCKIKEKRSKSVDEIVSFLKTFYKGIILKNDRNIIHPKEIDIYLPELKLGIEFNGVYFHMINHQNAYEKMKLCNAKGIKLIQIFDIQFSLEKSRILKAIKTCILYGGCVFLDKESHHSQQFPLFGEIEALEELTPKKIFLCDYYKKCPKSQRSYYFIDCGALIIDTELSKTLYQKVVC